MSDAKSGSSAIVNFHDISKVYGNDTVLNGLDLAVDAGDFMVIYGPPAAGKSVLMRLLMGLEQPTSGSVFLRGVDATLQPAAERNIGYIPQSFALYPHQSVRDNIAYPLKLMGYPKSEAEPVVQQVAEMLNISDLLQKRPDQLSGGQKQRVAIARGIAKQTEIYVLDDPLAGLDFKLREQLVDDLKALQQSWNVTFIYTTSDPIEALTLADQLAILNGGNIIESGDPERLYIDPSDARTMSLLGFPRANFLTGQLDVRDGGLHCTTELFEFTVDQAKSGAIAPAIQSCETIVHVGVRPEDLILGTNGASGAIQFDAQIALREDLGSEEIVYLESRGTTLTSVLRHHVLSADINDQAPVSVRPSDLIVFAPATGQRLGRGAATTHG